MMPVQPRPSAGARAGQLYALLRPVGRIVHAVALLGAVGVLLTIGGLFLRAAPQRKSSPVPPTMEDVDWHNPESSVYCLACHRQVSPAMAGLDVQRGHSQNVPLNDTQLRAVRDMGTVVGPNGTLICMSCHKLGQDSSAYMLADTLAGSQLCQRCHPGHYAQGTPHDLRQSAPTEPNRLGQNVAQGGPCSACHLSHRYAREIIPSPLDPDGYCITCHRAYHVAAEYARAQMEHPESHCLQCHNPHDMANGHFLREPGNELCLRCHAELGGGVAAGMHPLGPMDRPVPAELCVDDPTADDALDVKCVTCHSMHHAPYPQLLRMPPNSNDLCLACHHEQLAENSPHGVIPRHGQSPILDVAQRAVVTKWGTPIGAAGELLCASCHRVHGGQPEAALLVERPRYDETCLACHPNMLDVVGSPHDLRTSHPEERNTKGMTVLAAGACSACHLAHGAAREPAPTSGDPQGWCMNCHRPDECGQQKLPGAPDHPQTVCTDCHNPHERHGGNFLVQAGADLCLRCHENQLTLVGGPHDITAKAQLARWPAPARTQKGACLPCHVPHGGQRTDLFRTGGDQPVGNHDDVCLSCHADAAWEAPSQIAAIHPQQIAPEHSRVNLALVPTDEAGNKRMGCTTCHNPHGGADPVHLARVAPGEPTQALCVQCHREKEYVRLTGHSAEKLQCFEFDTDSCKPCHAMHARPNETWGNMLSPRFLMDRCVQTAGQPSTCLPCLACHYENGPAPAHEHGAHPEMIMVNINTPADPGYLPLFDPEGREAMDGQVVCRTCHVSHGRLELLQLMAHEARLTAEQQSAVRAQVRSYVAPNICSACHGDEGRRRFLYFHNSTMWKSAPPEAALLTPEGEAPAAPGGRSSR
jgi:predicted CXXCH cytochrome family protein